MIANLIWWIVVGLIAGWAAGKIMKGGGYGPAMDIVLGIVPLGHVGTAAFGCPAWPKAGVGLRLQFSG